MVADEKLLNEWVELYTEDLFSWAINKTSDDEIAKDLVQDTFLVAVEKMATFKGESSAKTWLFSILNNKIVDFYRKKVKLPTVNNDFLMDFFETDGGWKSNKSLLDWNEADSNLLDNNEFLLVLKKCMDALPEKWSASIKLKYLMNKKGEEICQELGIAPTNYWQIIHRAKLQLRDCIDMSWFKVPHLGI